MTQPPSTLGNHIQNPRVKYPWIRIPLRKRRMRKSLRRTIPLLIQNHRNLSQRRPNLKIQIHLGKSLSLAKEMRPRTFRANLEDY